VLRLETELRVTVALAGLPPDYQEVVVLRNFERLPFNDVAQRMGRSRPAAQMLWMRAIRELQEVLGEECEA
jgi:RNA polymerase sigma-70 factor (ECF subfamily)